jgi:hypothetical protein
MTFSHLWVSDGRAYALYWSPPSMQGLILRKVDPANRIVLAPEVLKHLDLGVGDYVACELAADSVVLYKVRVEKAKSKKKE